MITKQFSKCLRLEQKKRQFDNKLEKSLLIKHYCDLLSLTEKKDNHEIIFRKKIKENVNKITKDKQKLENKTNTLLSL